MTVKKFMNVEEISYMYGRIHYHQDDGYGFHALVFKVFRDLGFYSDLAYKLIKEEYFYKRNKK